MFFMFHKPIGLSEKRVPEVKSSVLIVRVVFFIGQKPGAAVGQSP